MILGVNCHYLNNENLMRKSWNFLHRSWKPIDSCEILSVAWSQHATKQNYKSLDLKHNYMHSLSCTCLLVITPCNTLRTTAAVASVCMQGSCWAVCLIWGTIILPSLLWRHQVEYDPIACSSLCNFSQFIWRQFWWGFFILSFRAQT